MLFKEENIYLNIARKIVAEGHVDTSRTGISIRKLHAQHMEFSLANGRIPVLSSRKVPLKAPIVELLWFISGKTNIKFLKENNSSIWDSWVIPGTEVYQNDIDTGIQALVSQGKIKLKPEFENREKLKDFLINYGGSASVNQMLEDLTGGSAPNMRLVDGSIGLGAYGAQWRNWRDVRIVENDNMVELGKLAKRGYDNMNEDIFPDCIAESTPDFTVMSKGYDQLQEAIELIKNNPDSRRIIVSAWNPGKLDLMSLPPCFTADANVATPDGYKKISDMEEGDSVYSGTGRIRTVVQKWVTKYEGEMIRIRANYINQAIECTPNHPFLVKGKGYIEAKDITEDDVLAIPRTKAIKNHIHKYSLIVGGGQVESHFEHELTLDDYFTLGYYLGNGWCNENKYRISIAIPHSKRSYILEKIRKTLKVAIKPGPNKSCATYDTKSKKFFELFKAFGKGAVNKRIPDFIMNSSIKMKYEFIAGYLEADGSIGGNGEKIFTTVSSSLAYGLQRLLIETGRMASVQYQVRPPTKVIEGRTINQRNTYSITITRHGGWHGQLKSTSFDTEYAWVGIKKIEKFDYSGFVYNIGLDEENTYLVNNVANHNCHSFFQFLPYERNGVTYLDLALTCRSQDFLVGTVFNVFQYGVLCHLVAHITGRIAGKLYWTGNNTHIYENQVQIFEEQHSERSPLSNPDLRLNINSDQPINNIDDFTLDMLSVSGYDNYDEVITYPIAV